MSTEIKDVIILGAGGNVGLVFLPILQEAKFNVSVVSRPESKSTFDSSVKVIKANYVADELESAFKGQDAVISLIGNAAFGQQKTLIDAAAAAGVKWFIPSEYGVDTTNPETVQRTPFLKLKIDAVEYLKTKESTGLSWTAFITGPFFDWGMHNGILDFDVAKKQVRIWDSGNAKFSTTTLPKIGEAVSGLLANPDRLDKAKNRYVSITSFTTSQNEILAAVEKASGQKWEVVEQVDATAVEKKALEAFKSGDYSMALDMIRAPMLGTSRPLGDNSRLKSDNDLLLPGNSQTVEEEAAKLLA